jgi:hypothetical protein
MDESYPYQLREASTFGLPVSSSEYISICD